MLGFEIKAVESDNIYERRGRVQRIVGIKRQWLHCLVLNRIVRGGRGPRLGSKFVALGQPHSFGWGLIEYAQHFLLTEA